MNATTCSCFRRHRNAYTSQVGTTTRPPIRGMSTHSNAPTPLLPALYDPSTKTPRPQSLGSNEHDRPRRRSTTTLHFACVGIDLKAKRGVRWLCESNRLVVKLMIPPTSRLGSVVATHASRARESLGLVLLFPFPSCSWGTIQALGSSLVGGCKGLCKQ